MAAAATDYFTKVGNPGSATTLAAPGHAVSGTSITVTSTTNWPTTTGVIFAIDTFTTVNGIEVRDVGSYTEWEGIVASSTSITNMTLRYGTDQIYAAGANTRVYIPVASSRENRLVDGLMVEHTQSGSHVMTSPKIITDISDTNGNELLKVTATGSAVNELTLANAATGNAPNLSATGGDTNVDIKLTPKGTGRVILNGAGAALSAVVATSETSTSPTYADLTTTTDTVTVTVGTSGLLLVGIYATSSNSGADAQCFTSFALSSGNTLAASDANAIQLRLTTATAQQSAGISKLLTGLTPGSTVVKMKYRVTGNTGTWLNRNIYAIPL